MLEHKGTKVLETERLILRRFNKEDGPSVFYNYSNDERVTRYMPWKPMKDVSEALEKCIEREEKYTNLDYYHWAIVIKETNELIGAIKEVDYSTNKECIEIGYCLGYNWWGKGYGTEALKEIIRYFFEDIGFNRIEATHQSDNIASGKIMEKCGMNFEGVLRGRGLNNNLEHVDSCMYAILKDDYII